MSPTTKAILEELGIESRDVYTADQVDEIAQLLHGRSIVGAMKRELQLSQQRVLVDQLEEEHSTSLGLLFQNETQKIELVQLNKKLEESYQLLEKMSRTDFLTRLNNRESILDLVSKELRRTFRAQEIYQKAASQTEVGASANRMGVFSLVIFDVDRFKTINDTYGHLTGDEVLKKIGECLSSSDVLRTTDSAGRFGGDEFLILLPNTPSLNAEVPLRKLKNALDRLHFQAPDGTEFQVTLSVGISENIPTDQSVKDVIERADKALYAAKQRGRNRIVVFETLDQSEIAEHDKKKEEQKSLSISMIPVWSKLDDLLHNIDTFLSEHSQDVKYATKMAASELAENAIKYGTILRDHFTIDVTVSLKDNVLKIVVVNPVEKSSADREVLKSILKKIETAADVKSLYEQRLNELLNNRQPKQPTRLGLIRIRYEGLFDLTYEELDDKISVTATRTVEQSS